MALRTPLSVTPHLYMGDSTGRPLDMGTVYFGEQDKDPEFYPITLYSDDALTLPLAQPVHTKGGYLYDKGDMVEPHAKEIIYSVKVLDSYGRKVFYKGAMMRNSWNDDVIEQINTAILEAQAETAAIAGQVAANAVDTAITDIAAAGASQNGWTDLLIATNIGGNQRNVNKRTAYEYNTVADMVADTKLTVDSVVATTGYHTSEDKGGAKYIVSSVPTDYSIPLSNGLHAVFNDKFDVRKFGIRDSATLDQSVELLRMRNYADDREYEIDFHGYSIMTPEIETSITTGTYRFIKGLYFHKVHKIKNLFIANDKSKQLRYNTIPLFFAPKEDGVGTFVLENVTFDPYVADFLLHPTSGDGDGSMHGFAAMWHGSYPVAWPLNQQTMTGYSTEYVNIEFITPAVSYNLATNFWCTQQTIKNAKGDYWGLYFWHWTDVLVAENVHGVFRDDLHTGSGRVLVTNLFLEEQEVGIDGFAYTQRLQSYTNISCTKKTTGLPYRIIVRQMMGKGTLKEFKVRDSVGNIEWYAGQGADKETTTHIINADIEGYNGECILWCSVDNLHIKDSTITQYINTYSRYTFKNVVFDHVKIPHTMPFTAGEIEKFTAAHCEFTSIYGLVRDGSAVFGDVELANCTVTKGWLFSGKLRRNITVQGLRIKADYYSRLIDLNDVEAGVAAKVVVNISGTVGDVGGGDGNLLVNCNGSVSAEVRAVNNMFKTVPEFVVGSQGSLVYLHNHPRLFVGFNLPTALPEILAGETHSFTITYEIFKRGDAVHARTTGDLFGLVMSAEVKTNGVVTVYLHNPTSVSITSNVSYFSVEVL